MGFSALAEVLAGWSGTLTINGVTTTPRTRESVASLIARSVAEVYAATGLVVSWTCSATGVLTCSAASAFDLVGTGVLDNRTGFTGTYTGAVTYTAAAIYTGAYVPTLGLRLSGLGLGLDRGASVADGSSGYAGPLAGGKRELVVWSSYADTWDAEADVSGVHDVWHDGRVFGRVRVDAWTRSPLSGSLRTGVMRLTADAQAVDE